MGQTALYNQKIRNLAGRTVNFDQGQEPWKYANLGRNTPIQSLNADIIKTAMASLYTEFKTGGVKLVNVVHDELVFEVPNEYAEQAAIIVKEGMEAAGGKYLKTVPCKVETVVGKSWQK